MLNLEALCEKELAWLFGEYGFRVIDSAVSALLDRTLLANEAAFVEVWFDNRESRLEVCLGLLVDGTIPRTRTGLVMPDACVSVASIVALHSGDWALCRNV